VLKGWAAVTRNTAVGGCDYPMYGNRMVDGWDKVASGSHRAKAGEKSIHVTCDMLVVWIRRRALIARTSPENQGFHDLTTAMLVSQHRRTFLISVATAADTQVFAAVGVIAARS
jgi:hypothetical protein